MRDERVDRYIKNAEPFARPILTHIRNNMHSICPELKETIKWGFPHFEYKGLLAHMASFSQHCTFGFWKSKIMDDPRKILIPVGKSGMGNFGKMESLDDLPDDAIFKEYVLQAMDFNERKVKLPSKEERNKVIDVPEYFVFELNRHSKAKKTFEEFSFTNKKEYVEWITEAKTESTRKNRLATAIEWMSEGKVRNWKYIK